MGFVGCLKSDKYTKREVSEMNIRIKIKMNLARYVIWLVRYDNLTYGIIIYHDLHDNDVYHDYDVYNNKLDGAMVDIW